MKILPLEQRLSAVLGATAVFAMLGGALEWRHPGLVSDVVPWSLLAGLGGALILGMAVLGKGKSAAAPRWLVVATSLGLALAAALAAYALFAPIPRLQPILAATAAAIVLLGTVALRPSTDD